jgi:hypothetical protein
LSLARPTQRIAKCRTKVNPVTGCRKVAAMLSRIAKPDFSAIMRHVCNQGTDTESGAAREKGAGCSMPSVDGILSVPNSRCRENHR